MSSQHHPSPKSHASRHHRHARPDVPRPAARATAAEVAGVTGALERLGEESRDKAARYAEEMLLKVPKPMLAGLGAGLLVGGAAVYLWNQHQKSDGHAAQIADEREARATKTHER